MDGVSFKRTEPQHSEPAAHRAEAAPRERPQETSLEGEAQVQGQKGGGALPVLAVRTGPAPIETPQTIVEARLRDGLSERAVLTRIAQILSIQVPTVVW
jgi:hypothetical protein